MASPKQNRTSITIVTATATRGRSRMWCSPAVRPVRIATTVWAGSSVSSGPSDARPKRSAKSAAPA